MDAPAKSAERGVILYLHGSGFCVHLPATCRAFCADLVRRSELPVLLPDYRLALEHPAPASAESCTYTVAMAALTMRLGG